MKIYYTKEVQYPTYTIYRTLRGETSDTQQKGLYTKYEMYHTREVNYPKYKTYHTREEKCQTYNEWSVYKMTYKKGAHTQISPTPPFRY